MKNRFWLRRALVVAAACGSGLVSPSASGADPGASVLVIYNSRMPESRELAAYYARQRHVPTNQLFGFDLPSTEEIRREEFLAQLQSPLLARLEAAGLWTLTAAKKGGFLRSRSGERRLLSSTIRYAVLCYGVPTRIAEDRGLTEKELDDLKPELRRNEASVDSQLACLPSGLGSMRWAGPIPNPAYAVTNASLLHPTNGVFLVCRLDGPSPDVARRLVDQALEAETNGLWGRAYFDARGTTNAAFELGDSWINNAQKICRVWGFGTELDTNEQVFPVGKVLSDVALYAGWYAANPSGALGLSKVEFQPGAFAYHLHSFSARVVRTSTAHWVGPLLSRGAAATIGYVAEPYLVMTADLPVFFSRWVLQAYSFGEAAYAALNALSWQSVVVGDPLYRPFAQNLPELHRELERRNSPWLAWSHLLVVNRNQVMGTPAGKLIRYLESIPVTRQSAVLTEKVGDLYWEGKEFNNALETYELALQRNPTPTQQMRLLLRLAELRSYFGPATKALDYYQTLLAQHPNYPDPLDVYRKMLVLARSAGDDKTAERCEAEIKRRSPAQSP